MTGWSVMMRGIRHRSGRSLVMLLLAAFATAAAVLAPAYGTAARQSVLTDSLRAAPASAAALTVAAEGSSDTAPAAHQPIGEARAAVDAALARTPALKSVLGTPIASVDLDSLLTRRPGRPFAAQLSWRTGVCEHLRMTDGQCPIAPEQVVLSERSAAEAGVEVGDVLSARPAKVPAQPALLKVVGLYTPADPAEGYWGNNGYFAHGVQSGESGAPRLDAAFTGSEDDVRLGETAPVKLQLAYPLRADEVGLDDVPAIRVELGALGLSLNASEMALDTALLSIVDDAAEDQAALGRTVPVIAVPLLLLAWFVLFIMVAALTEERGPELALARLRGFPHGRTVRFGLGEALLLIVVGAPLGLLAGLGLVELAARTVLAEGTHVEPRWPVFAAAGVGLLVACLAAWLAGRRTIGRGVLGLLRRVPQRTTWRAGALEGVAATLAIASLAAALRDRSAPLALLAPAALAVVAGIAAGRLLTLWSALRLRVARRRGSLSAMLAAAALSRRPGAARTVAVLTVAVALLGFSVVAWDVAARARAQRADDELGAPTVHVVTAAHPQALIDAVVAADPSHHTMAVVRSDEQYADGRVELLGVQSDRLDTVAVWQGHDQASLASLAARLTAGKAAPAILTGAVTLRLSTVELGQSPVRVGALISTPGEPPTLVGLGDLRAGASDYTGVLPTCRVGCRLVGIGFGRGAKTAASAPGPVHATVDLLSVTSNGTPVAVRLGDTGAWPADTQGTPNAKVTVTASPTGDGAALRLAVTSPDQGDVLVSYLDTPVALPAVLAGAAPSAQDAEAFAFPGFAGVPQRFAVLERAAVLPRAGGHGLLFDLDLAVRAASATAGLSDATDLRYEVWTTGGAPADLTSRLAAQGIRVLRTETVDGRLDQLGRRAPALGLRLYLLAGLAAALLALGVLALSLHLDSAGRRAELAALRITGVDSRVLRRALRRERLTLLGLPLLVGLAAGVAGAVLMLPGIPLVTVGSVGLPGELRAALMPRPALEALPVTLVAAVLVLLATVARAGRLVRRATPDLIRGGSR